MHSSALFCAYDFQVTCYLWIRSISLFKREENSKLSLCARRNFWLDILDVKFLHLLRVKIQRFYIQTPNGGAAVKENSLSNASLFQLLSLWFFFPFLSPLFLFSLYLPCFVRSAYLPNCLISHERWGFHCRGTNCIYLPADPPIDVKRKIPAKGTLHDGSRNVHTLHILYGHFGETWGCVI
jgi:hypothetical protein